MFLTPYKDSKTSLVHSTDFPLCVVFTDVGFILLIENEHCKLPYYLNEIHTNKWENNKVSPLIWHLLDSPFFLISQGEMFDINLATDYF